jgi:hypothetical protein
VVALVPWLVALVFRRVVVPVLSQAAVLVVLAPVPVLRPLLAPVALRAAAPLRVRRSQCPTGEVTTTP